MSSEMFVFENFLFSDPFSPFTDTPFEILQEIEETSSNLIQENSSSLTLIQENNNNPVDEMSSFDQITSGLLSSSPPSVELEGLSLSQLGNTEYSALEVKTEQCRLNFDGAFYGGNANSFLPQSYDDETTMKFMQRSYSSNSFENKQNFTFRPQFDGVMESQIFSSPQGSSFNSGQIMRRVCSTGDLQKVKTNMQTKHVLSSSPLSTEKSFMEETNFKVGRYSAEERKERIDRYKAKRTQRNFNKTIKYACRKTLADNRPRVRGRFARNDEAGDIPKSSSISYKYEDEDDHLWMEGFHEECEEGIARRAPFFNSFSSTQYNNFSYC